MAFEIPVSTLGTQVAAADLRTKQFYAVKIDSSSKMALAGAGENAIGILQNKPNINQAASVETLGVTKAKYGNTVTAGQNLMVKSDGTLIPHTGTNAVIGIAIDGGSVDEIRTVILVTRTGAGLSATYSIVTIPIILANLADGDIVTEYIPGFAGTIQKASFLVTDPVTTAAKLSTLNLEIESTDLTGGVIALTSANCTPLGVVIDGTAITADNVFADTEKISVEASSTTTFIEGEGILVLVLTS